MSFKLLASALALAAVTLPSAALADDPLDPKMQNADAIERDRQLIAALNRDMLAQVQERDARYSAGWQAYREQPQRLAEYQQRVAAFQREQDTYAAERKRYEQAMADWKRNVAACRAGNYAACN